MTKEIATSEPPVHTEDQSTPRMSIRTRKPTKEQTKILDKVKFDLLVSGAPFLVSLGFRSNLKITDDIPTAATDGRSIVVNPKFFFESLANNQERLYVYAHEIWHMAFMHMVRRHERDPVMWNIAGDYVINYLLTSNGFGEPPCGGLYDTAYAGMSTDEVYKILEADASKLPQLGMDDLLELGSLGTDGEGKPFTDADGKPIKDSKVVEAMVKAQLQESIQAAAMAAKQAGAKPGDLPEFVQRMIEEMGNPKLPWYVILQNYVNGFAKDDYSWQRPSKRFMPDMIIPSLYSETLERINVYIDISGSVSNADYTAFITELVSMFDSVNPQAMGIIGFNTQITEEVVCESSEDIRKLVMLGNGGTSIQPVVKHIAENSAEISIVLTDGYYREPEFNPQTPVLWVIYDNPDFTCDWGTIVHFDLEGAKGAL